ncbi:LOW QUALITY PROTEIN: folate-biopterin transporter 6 [Populus alba x Populus x berolinensis]|nr:LOW QUALITY PROTEIN: folate-biopterin transporter 6 [Populus alba x Populus x berolinensis]
MDHLETRDLVERTPTDSSKEDDCRSSKTCFKNKSSLHLMEPFQWLQMLSSQLNPHSFLLWCMVLARAYLDLSLKLLQTTTGRCSKGSTINSSVVHGFNYIPWVMKPIWGLFTDVFSVRGYNRRPYFIVAGVLGCVSALMKLFLVRVAIADVTIDACIAKKSIEIRALAPDMQSLCGFCSSLAALIGYSSSGFFVHHLGPQAGKFMLLQVSLVLLAVPPALLIVLGFVIYEVRSTSLNLRRRSLQIALRGMSKTIKLPQVWKPSLYMYLSLALTHEGHFYWYTDPKAGPAFSQEFVGIIYAVGALASIAGVLIYQKALKNYPFRSLILYAQLLYGMSGMLDLTFVLRWNLALGIPDFFFVIAEECVTRIISRIRWMP